MDLKWQWTVDIPKIHRMNIAFALNIIMHFTWLTTERHLRQEGDFPHCQNSSHLLWHIFIYFSHIFYQICNIIVCDVQAGLYISIIISYENSEKFFEQH